MAEVGTATNPDLESATWPTFVTGGMIYSVLGNLDFDMGVKGSLTNAGPDMVLLTGITYKFP